MSDPFHTFFQQLSRKDSTKAWALLGSRLVHEEARWGRLGNARWLVEQGADPNLADGMGRTPLHWAARRGARPDWFAAMVSLGADVDRVDHDGHTPSSIARSKNKKRLITWFEGQKQIASKR